MYIPWWKKLFSIVQLILEKIIPKVNNLFCCKNSMFSWHWRLTNKFSLLTTRINFFKNLLSEHWYRSTKMPSVMTPNCVHTLNRKDIFSMLGMAIWAGTPIYIWRLCMDCEIKNIVYIDIFENLNSINDFFVLICNIWILKFLYSFFDHCR